MDIKRREIIGGIGNDEVEIEHFDVPLSDCSMAGDVDCVFSDENIDGQLICANCGVVQPINEETD